MKDNKMGIGEYVEKSLTLFGEDVNTQRQLPLIYDGLKPVYRRVIYETLTNSVGVMAKTAAISGHVISTNHPHGTASVEPPISNLVRWGILDGQGNHGMKSLMGDDIDAAAPRYTEAKISQKYLNIFKELMPYVPYKPAEIQGEEPEYLPTPVPLCLTYGTLGIGHGANTRIPAFTVRSMMNALKHNNPKLLEAPFGLKLIPSECEFDLLWTKGIGKLTYTFNVYEASSESGYGCYIEGEPELFKPDLSVFNQLRDLGRIYINNETDKTGNRIFIGRNYNVKSITYDQIKEMAEKASKYVKTFRLTVSNGKKIYLIPLRDWLKTTHDNYIEVIKRYKEDKISKFEFDYEVYKYLPQVVELLYKNRELTAEQIANTLKIKVEIVSSVLSKSINTLRNTDSGTKKLESLQEKINYYKNLNPLIKINELINEF
jgi:hypothetical protein